MQDFEFERTETGLRVKGFPDAVGLVCLDEKMASRLADLRLHMNDLAFGLACLEEIEKQPGDAWIVRQALWRSAVIHYMKCYGSSDGRPSTLNRDAVFRGQPEAQNYHDYVDSLRDKHVVHDDNAFAQCITGAIVNPPNAARKVENVVCTTFIVQTYSVEDHANMRLLLNNARDWVSGQYEECTRKIMQELEQQPYDALLARGAVVYKVPEREDVHKTRTMPRLTKR